MKIFHHKKFAIKAISDPIPYYKFILFFINQEVIEKSGLKKFSKKFYFFGVKEVKNSGEKNTNMLFWSLREFTMKVSEYP